LNPARPDISVLYNPFHCADDDYMPVVNMVFGSFSIEDLELRMKEQGQT
jgi:hypothetical protein